MTEQEARLSQCGPESSTLCAFSRFKESCGRQRAFLCGALSLTESDIETFSSRAFADLVVCVHQQARRRAATAQALPRSKHRPRPLAA